MQKLGKAFVYASPFGIVFLIHYISTNLYTSICASMSLTGFLRSIVVAGSPMCSTLLSIINYTQNSYGLIVAGLGTTVIHNLSNWCKCEHPT